MNVSDEICTVAVYNLKMCMKEDGPGPKYFKGDKYLVQDGCILFRFDSQFSFIYPNCTVILQRCWFLVIKKEYYKHTIIGTRCQHLQNDNPNIAHISTWHAYD